MMVIIILEETNGMQDLSSTLMISSYTMQFSKVFNLSIQKYPYVFFKDLKSIHLPISLSPSWEEIPILSSDAFLVHIKRYFSTLYFFSYMLLIGYKLVQG